MDGVWMTAAQSALFAENLAALRLARQPRLSQALLARRFGISRSTYDRYEKGITQPPAWFVIQVARYYGVAVEQLYTQKLPKGRMK
jgi:transcriptional regulator with XRE-family HTH domain